MSKAKGILHEFKDFIARGNAVDLAVGIIIGAAFTAIVNSLVNDLIMPIVGFIIGGNDISSLAITIGEVSLQYGLFLQAVVNFILIAFVVFIIVKSINSMRKKKEEVAEVEAVAEEVELLREIRDSLKK